MALYAALDYAGITVYDEVDVDQATPYVVIGEGTEAPDDTHTDLGTSETVVIHIWSRETGARECKVLMGEVDTALHHRTLYLTGGGSVNCTREFAEVITEEAEPGERWRHGVMRYRMRTEEP
jgi:hypothetical protein